MAYPFVKAPTWADVERILAGEGVLLKHAAKLSSEDGDAKSITYFERVLPDGTVIQHVVCIPDTEEMLVPSVVKSLYRGLRLPGSLFGHDLD